MYKVNGQLSTFGGRSRRINKTGGRKKDRNQQKQKKMEQKNPRGIKTERSWAWPHAPVTPGPRRLNQNNCHKSEASLGSWTNMASFSLLKRPEEIRTWFQTKQFHTGSECLLEAGMLWEDIHRHYFLKEICNFTTGSLEVSVLDQ